MTRSFIFLLVVTLAGLCGCTTQKKRVVFIPGIAETGTPVARTGEPRKSLLAPNKHAGKVSKLDLRAAPEGTYFSLQIARFESEDNSVRKTQALAYTKQLRDEGSEAYYYHGPNMSVVTVGSFKDAVLRVGRVTKRADGSKRLVLPTPSTRYSPQVEALQKKHPYHLLNGRKLYFKRNGVFMTYPRGHPLVGQKIAHGSRPVGIPGRKAPI